MAAFPTLSPSSRTFTPGEYPHSPFTAWSGRQNRVRLSNVMLSSQLQLSFLAISEAEMLSILAHYRGQVGRFSSFPLPSDVFSGATTASDFTLSGYGWVYAEPPSVEDLPCGGHNVSLSLVSVPPEGTALIGLNALVRVQFAAGSASAGSGAQLTVAVTLAPGNAGLPGLDQSVTVTLAAGTATSGVSVAGLSHVVFVSLANSVSQSAFGLQSTVTVSLAGGTATGVETDPNFSSVSLLLHMDGSNNSTTFTDNSNNAFTITAFGTAKLTTSDKKYGTAAGNFPGWDGLVTGSYIQPSSSSAFAFGTGDFTVEMWLKPTSVSGNGGVFSIGSGLSLALYSSGWQLANSNSNPVSMGSATAGTWQHVAITRSGTSVKLFINGVQKGSTLTWSTDFTATNLTIGYYFGSAFYGYRGLIDEFRVTKGVARTITVPTGAYPDS